MTATIFRGTIFSALLILSMAGATGAAEPAFVPRKVGGSEIRLPLVGGMIAACDKHSDLASRAAMLTPASHEFITCLASELAVSGIRNQVRLEGYPVLSVALTRAHPSGPLTLAEFEQIRSRSQQYLRAQMATPEATQKSLDQQDQAIEAKGGTLKRKNEGMEMGEYVVFTRDLPSFSYSVTRQTTLTEAGASERICEVNFVSSLYIQGGMLMISVVDHCAGAPKEARAKALTREWLLAFERLNKGNR